MQMEMLSLQVSDPSPEPTLHAAACLVPALSNSSSSVLRVHGGVVQGAVVGHLWQATVNLTRRQIQYKLLTDERSGTVVCRQAHAIMPVHEQTTLVLPECMLPSSMSTSLRSTWCLHETDAGMFLGTHGSQRSMCLCETFSRWWMNTTLRQN